MTHPSATTPPKSPLSHLQPTLLLNAARLSVAKSNYFPNNWWCVQIYPSDSRDHAPNPPPAVGSAEKLGGGRGGYLNRWGLILVLTGLAFVRWGKMTTPYRLWGVLGCTEMVCLFRRYICAPSPLGGQHTTQTKKKKAKPLLTNFSTTNFHSKICSIHLLVQKSPKNKHAVKVI